MDTCSPESLWVLHLRSAESDPGPIARTTPGTDHICGLRILQGQNRLGHGYEGSVLRAHTGWTRARLWAVAAAMGVDCWGGGGGGGIGGGGGGAKK